VEAYGARQIAKFGRFLGLNSVILEGDALAIISALGRTEVDYCNYGCLIMDAKNILRGFGSWGLSHIRRKGNMVAHILAKFVVFSEQTKVRFGTCKF
jgi:hypothetical protein